MKQADQIKKLSKIAKQIEEQQQHQKDFEQCKFEVRNSSSYWYIEMQTPKSSLIISRYMYDIYEREEVEKIAQNLQSGLMYFVDQQYLDLKAKIKGINESFELTTKEEQDAK